MSRRRKCFLMMLAGVLFLTVGPLASTVLRGCGGSSCPGWLPLTVSALSGLIGGFFIGWLAYEASKAS